MDIYLKKNANDDSMVDLMTKEARGWMVWATVHEDFYQCDTIMSLSFGEALEEGNTVKLHLVFMETLP